MSAQHDKDIEASHADEKGSLGESGAPELSNGSQLAPEDEVKRAREIQSLPVLKQLRQVEEKLDKLVGIELKGIDRVTEEEKQPPSIWNIFFLWWSLNVHVGVIPLGLLGAEFGLTLRQNIAATTIGSILGALCTAYTGTLSPKLGLRQIAVSRYSFGFYGAKLCSVINIVVGGGFFIVNLVVVGSILSAVSDFTMTLTVGIVVISIISYVLSIFGYRLIHTFEKYSWIFTLVLFFVLIGQVTPYVDANASPATPLPAGLPLAGSFLTILSITFSNASGWCSIAGDYYVHFPATTPRWKVFTLTYFGVLIPVTISIVTGCLLGNAALTADNPMLAEAYDAHGLGGLIREVYHPLTWSKFALVFLALSVAGNNIAINYSSGLSLQLLGHWFHAIPRFIWSLLFAIVVAVIAIAGKEHLSLIVSNFVSLLGYWTVCFSLVLGIEDLFRRRSGYDLTAWDDPKRLPWGAAGVTSLLAGYLAGGVPGMAQTWYVGPIAAKFSSYGGDVGIYMAAAITLVVFPPLRLLEKRFSGK